MRRPSHQLTKGSQLLPLHQVALQPLLVLEAAPGIFQQVDQRLVLKILAHKNKHAQHQHRCQDGA